MNVPGLGILEHYILAGRLDNIAAGGKAETRLVMPEYNFIIYAWRGRSDFSSNALMQITNTWDDTPWLSQPLLLKTLLRSFQGIDKQPSYFLVPKFIPAGQALLWEVWNNGSVTLFAELSLWGVIFRQTGRISVAPTSAA